MTAEQLAALYAELGRRHVNADQAARDYTRPPYQRHKAQVRADALAEALALLGAIEHGRPYR